MQNLDSDANHLRIGVVQFRSTDDPWRNLLLVNDYVSAAAQAGCALVCFPENVFYRGPREPTGFAREELFLSVDGKSEIAPITDFSRALREIAQDWPLAVSLGSVLERSPTPLPYNSHWVVHADHTVSRYQKIHLFDYSGQGASYKESRDVSAGLTPVTVNLSRGTRGGPKLGLSVCYDLRFPELYRVLSVRLGAQVLLAPSAFTLETGRAHWHTLLRARAIENLSFVVAAAQWGAHFNARGEELWCYGHSIVLGPWGETLAEAREQGDEMLVVDIDFSSLQRAREKLPALQGTKLLQGASGSSSGSNP
jgi:nitrilase